MERVKLGIILEGKTPPDKRVPISPEQCEELMGTYPMVDLYVQRSPVRKYQESSYEEHGVTMVDSVDHCDILMGVKEVPLDQLIPNKTYFFFSHTTKEQPYNAKLLKTILEKDITMIDWEGLTQPNGIRLIGFGRYAGIVGSYNGLLAYGKRTGAYDIKAANACADRVEMEGEYTKIKLPNIKIAITGAGRVAKGAMEVLDGVGIRKVAPADYLTQSFDEPVYTQLLPNEYYKRKSDGGFEKSELYSTPGLYESNFMTYGAHTDLFIPCHFWDSEAPFLFTREDAKSDAFNIKVVADISCDIDGPIASTIRPSTIADPIYGYDPVKEEECDFKQEGCITVMAVDNLPCELPMDASKDFGSELLKHILPALFGEDEDQIIERAMIAKNGELTAKYAYLSDYVKNA